jgi:hypothetical protein
MCLPRTDTMEPEGVVATFADRLTIIDATCCSRSSGCWEPRPAKSNVATTGPIDNVAAGRWQDVQTALTREAMPFKEL